MCVLADWAHRKNALFAFLTLASTFTNILLNSWPPSMIAAALVDPSTQIAVDILVVLSSFTPLVETAQGGVEGYHQTLYSCLDIIAARGKASGSRLLFDTLRSADAAADVVGMRDGFALVCAESLIHTLEARTVTFYLWPTCER